MDLNKFVTTMQLDKTTEIMVCEEHGNIIRESYNHG
jgi:hypothetical protein